MTSEPKLWVKPIQQGRMKGVYIPLDQETWENALKESNIPIDTPIEKLRIKRYMTKSRNILLRVKHIDKIPEDELNDRR